MYCKTMLVRSPRVRALLPSLTLAARSSSSAAPPARRPAPLSPFRPPSERRRGPQSFTIDAALASATNLAALVAAYRAHFTQFDAATGAHFFARLRALTAAPSTPPRDTTLRRRLGLVVLHALRGHAALSLPALIDCGAALVALREGDSRLWDGLSVRAAEGGPFPRPLASAWMTRLDDATRSPLPEDVVLASLNMAAAGGVDPDKAAQLVERAAAQLCTTLATGVDGEVAAALASHLRLPLPSLLFVRASPHCGSPPLVASFVDAAGVLQSQLGAAGAGLLLPPVELSGVLSAAYTAVLHELYTSETVTLVHAVSAATPSDHHPLAGAGAPLVVAGMRLITAGLPGALAGVTPRGVTAAWAGALAEARRTGAGADEYPAGSLAPRGGGGRVEGAAPRLLDLPAWACKALPPLALASGGGLHPLGAAWDPPATAVPFLGAVEAWYRGCLAWSRSAPVDGDPTTEGLVQSALVNAHIVLEALGALMGGVAHPGGTPVAAAAKSAARAVLEFTVNRAPYDRLVRGLGLAPPPDGAPPRPPREPVLVACLELHQLARLLLAVEETETQFCGEGGGATFAGASLRDSVAVFLRHGVQAAGVLVSGVGGGRPTLGLCGSLPRDLYFASLTLRTMLARIARVPPSPRHSPAALAGINQLMADADAAHARCVAAAEARPPALTSFLQKTVLSAPSYPRAPTHSAASAVDVAVARTLAFAEEDLAGTGRLSPPSVTAVRALVAGGRGHGPALSGLLDALVTPSAVAKRGLTVSRAVAMYPKDGGGAGATVGDVLRAVGGDLGAGAFPTMEPEAAGVEEDGDEPAVDVYTPQPHLPRVVRLSPAARRAFATGRLPPPHDCEDSLVDAAGSDGPPLPDQHHLHPLSSSGSEHTASSSSSSASSGESTGDEGEARGRPPVAAAAPDAAPPGLYVSPPLAAALAEFAAVRALPRE